MNSHPDSYLKSPTSRTTSPQVTRAWRVLLLTMKYLNCVFNQHPPRLSWRKFIGSALGMRIQAYSERGFAPGIATWLASQRLYQNVQYRRFAGSRLGEGFLTNGHRGSISAKRAYSAPARKHGDRTQAQSAAIRPTTVLISNVTFGKWTQEPPLIIEDAQSWTKSVTLLITTHRRFI